MRWSPRSRRASGAGKDVNWIRNFVRPKIRSILGGAEKRDVGENMWVKDPDSGQMVFYKDLEDNLFVMPGSGHHMRMKADARLRSMFDGGAWDTIELPAVTQDPLKFRDERRYTDRLKEARQKTGGEDAILAGSGTLDGLNTVMAVQDFAFMGGSLGLAAGEHLIAAMRAALAKRTPMVLFAASGGARMQEGILSLMQMPRTTVAVQDLRAAKLPYVVVLTDPTMGGVTASFAMLGDVQIAEPGALIGFAGPRVIEQTIREKLPDGFQRAEYLRDHGMADMVVSRLEMRQTVSRVLQLLLKRPAKPAGGNGRALVPQPAE